MKKLLCALFLLSGLAALLALHGDMLGINRRESITLVMWHSFVEDMQDSLDELINEFNHTVGAENGITVRVTLVTDARIINEQLIAAANNDPGAPRLPDMVVAYPRVAITLAEKGLLVDLEQYFSRDELDTFVPQFIEEGRMGTEQLYIMPITKSAEVLYVNRTFFDRFSKETGIGIEKLSTFEGIVETAMKYQEWTDALTPDIPHDGKMLFYPERLFNQALIGFQQLGADIIKDNKLNLSDPAFQRIWDNYYIPAVKGGVAVYDGFTTYLATIGDVVCATSSSAGSTFYPFQVIYADNTREDVVFDVLPFPVFAGGEKVIYQQGGGICVTKSEGAREYAACLFLKWFTESERNLRFCSNLGYMPVRQSAFDAILAGDFPAIANPVTEKALIVLAEMQKDYRFYFPPVFDGFESLQLQYADRLRQTARSDREEYLRLLQTHNEAQAFDIVSRNAMKNFIERFDR